MKSYYFYSVDNFTRISNYLRSVPLKFVVYSLQNLLSLLFYWRLQVILLYVTTSLPRHTPRLFFLFTMWFNLSVLILCFYILCKFISYLIFNLTCIFNSIFPFSNVCRNKWKMKFTKFYHPVSPLIEAGSSSIKNWISSGLASLHWLVSSEGMHVL